MFLIKGGRVKLTKVLEDGNELTLDIRKAGDFVGENMCARSGRSEQPDCPCLESRRHGSIGTIDGHRQSGMHGLRIWRDMSDECVAMDIR